MKKTVSLRYRLLNYLGQLSWKTSIKIMRFSLVIFLGIIATSQWLTASPSTGQSIEAVKVTLSLKNESLIQTFQKIEKQTAFRFMFRKEEVKHVNHLTQQLISVPLDQVLKAILVSNGLNYRQIGQRIMVEPQTKIKTESPVKQDELDKQWSIRGKVTDASQEGLPGVSILIRGTESGTTTDKDGNFTLEVTDQDAVLIFSFVGFLKQEIQIEGRNFIEVLLQADESHLEELVVVGYGTQKKVNMTGAVDVISNDQIGNRQASTVSQILQGQSPGLDFSVGGGGFEPGASMKVTLRGVGSLNGGGPFVLIDGFPGDMDRLNPSDIESISVLKDAAASAIYGARAPYGVILITTKSGKKNQKMTVTYNGSVAKNSATRLPEMLDSHTFAKVMNEMGDNGGGRPYSNAAIERVVAYQNQDWDYLKKFMRDDFTHYEAMPLANGRFGHNADSHANYDWYKEFYGSSINTQQNLAVQGGTEKISYYLSGGFVSQNGVLNYGVDTFRRFNLIGKFNASLTKWWDVRYESRLMKSPRDRFNSIGMDGYESMFRQVTRTIPTQSKFDGFGNYSNQSKIPLIEQGGTNKTSNTENWHTIATEIRPLKGWKINADFAYKTNIIDQNNVNTVVYETMTDRSKTEFAGSLPSDIERILTSNNYWAANLFTSYDLQLKKNHFGFLTGIQHELDQTNLLTALRTNLMVSDVPAIGTANGVISASESRSHWSTLGYFGRLTYDFDQKYLFEANVRYDGTSKFLSGNRWGFFPSFSAGWNIDRENFWKSIEPYVTSFKIRASWGQLGNQQVRPYMDLALMPLKNEKLNWIFDHGNTRPVSYTGTPGLVSPQLTWETSTTKNLGFNTSFLRRRLQLDVDIFERITDKMIGPSAPVSGTLGSSVPKDNNATLKSTGFEGILRWNDKAGTSGLNYFINLNLHNVKSVVQQYLNPTGLISDWYEGKEVGEIWGYTANELFKSKEDVTEYLSKVNMSFINSSWNPGDVKYLDINGDGKVNMGTQSLSNPGDLSKIGNNLPRYQYGISGGLDYKGFDFSFLVKGTAKRDFFVGNGNQNIRQWGYNTWLFIGMTPEHLDYFRDKPGTETAGLQMGESNINLDGFFPRPYLNPTQNDKNRHTSTRYLLNAAYWRLQHMQIGYSISKPMLHKLKLQKLRVYVSGENLFTNTKLLKGIDPVAILGWGDGVGNTYGADRILSIGISSTF